MGKKIRIGLIGLGRIYPRHVDDSIEQLDELELVAVCDIDKKLSREVGKKKGVRYYDDFKNLVNDDEVDVVAIATPNSFHYPIAKYVAKRNKHCILEKPIALNHNMASRLVEAFEISKGALFPVLQVRYNPAIQATRYHVHEGNLGRIFTAALTIRWTRPQEYFDQSDWKGTKKIDGGSLITQAIHYIDTMQYILGRPKIIYGKVDRLKLDIETEDAANAIIDFENGTRANFEFTICTYPQNLESSLAILGEKGTIKIGGLAMNELETWNVEDTPQPSITKGLTPNHYAGGMYVGSCPNHKAIYQNLVNVLVHGKPSFINGSDALPSLEIIDTIKKSSRLKREIRL